MSEFKENGRFEYYKLKLKWKAKSLRQKAQQKLTSRSVFPFPLLFRRLSTVFFIDSERNETIPLHFRNVFHFFSEKNSLSKTFLVECVRSGAASCNKRREFWRETRTPLWLLIGRIIFLTREKTSFAILIGRIVFFTCENHRSLLWLAITNLRTKIYDIAFWWVFLSMCIIKIWWTPVGYEELVGGLEPIFWVNNNRVVTWYIRDPLIPIFLPLFWSLSLIFPKIFIPEPW